MIFSAVIVICVSSEYVCTALQCFCHLLFVTYGGVHGHLESKASKCSQFIQSSALVMRSLGSDPFCLTSSVADLLQQIKFIWPKLFLLNTHSRSDCRLS